MTIQYASDLHLEFPENKKFIKSNPLQPKGNILLLAGDIVPFNLLDKHKDFFTYLSDNFETTYWIPGNHEYYHFDVTTKCRVINEKIKSNVFLVNNTSVLHQNSKLIFSTLWSKISNGNQWEIEKSMSDFQVIKYNGYRFSVDRFNQLHEDSIAFINMEVQQQTTENIVVATHHIPTFLNYPKQYKGDILNEAFAVELFDTIESSNINYWIYGHHHTNTPDFKIGKTTLLTNQLAYLKHDEHNLFSTQKTFEL